MRLVVKGSFFSFEFRFFEISKERHSKERSIYAYIRMNKTFLSKRILKERQTNFERTLFDQTTCSESSSYFFCFSSTLQYFLSLLQKFKGSSNPRVICQWKSNFQSSILFFLNPKNIVIVKHLTKKRKLISLQHVRNAAKRQIKR